jgi:hypothetical protein
MLAATPAFAAPAQVAEDGWTLSCQAGRDEFASNCQAQRRLRTRTVELATGDSQVFLGLSAPGCPAVDRDEQENWWRDELAGLPAKQRRAVFERSLKRMDAALGTRCPKAAPEAVGLGRFPDIAVHGEP